jgi:DNA-directed RNA polymerase subunit RPC12/RpoP
MFEKLSIFEMSAYNVRAVCGNCGKFWTASIPQGTARTEWSRTAECQYCGVKGKITTSTL